MVRIHQQHKMLSQPSRCHQRHLARSQPMTSMTSLIINLSLIPIPFLRKKQKRRVMSMNNTSLSSLSNNCKNVTVRMFYRMKMTRYCHQSRLEHPRRQPRHKGIIPIFSTLLRLNLPLLLNRLITALFILTVMHSYKYHLVMMKKRNTHRLSSYKKILMH